MMFDFAAAYDDLNPDDHDHRFYARLAEELGARRVLDLGCGTGTLARLLAARGHDVAGIDPDPRMLRVARAKPGGEPVDWRLGHSAAARTGEADLAVMTGHVAQVFRDDDAWGGALRDLRRAVAPYGNIAFESRNPAVRAWERWTREATLRVVQTTGGPVEFWHETAWVSLPLVGYDTYTRAVRTGEENAGRDVLAFRDEAALVRTVEAAGFSVVRRLGDWRGSPLTADSPEIILVAAVRE